VPLVLDDVAAGFLGETADARTVVRIANAVAGAIEPYDQAEISAAYRRDLVKALMTRALQRVTAGIAGIAGTEQHG
jgi:carbon-monoxide dehydrogenase medium subunit